MADMFKVKVITPDRVFYEGDVSMVELRTTEGDIGVYRNHIPLTCIVAPGVLNLHEADGVKKAALHTGFVEILQEQVTILAEVAEWPDEIDRNRAEEARNRAERRLSGEDGSVDVARAELALRKALLRLKLTEK
jgi:F-type H+-transporting ATPase subunit epsilon